MLASDLNNTEFVGAKNPDDILHIEFYDYAALDTWKTQQTGIKSYKDSCPFIRIAIPGNPNLTVERPADGKDTKRWPRQWLFFQMQTGKIANAENVPGWQIDQWDELGEEQVRQLKFLRFYTVEQIAGANDAQIQGIGMGGQGLREKAKRALHERNSVAVNAEVQARDTLIAEMRAQMAEMMEMIKQRPTEAAEPAKRGRKPREAANA
jgi:hypothetical protein